MRSSTMIGVTVLFLLQLSVSLAAQIIPGERAQDVVRRREEAGRREEADFRRRMNDLNTLERRSRLMSRKPPVAYIEPKITSEARERILRLRHVDQVDIEKYTAFLGQKDTGIFKIFPDLGCVSKNVIRINGDCERFVPMSSSFTFRTNAYGDGMYHDIHFESDRISSDSFFSQGIFVAIGDEPIENIDLSHRALKYLLAFEPAPDPKVASDHVRKFHFGVDSGGYEYADSISPKDNVTYVLRTIAYRLENGLKPISEQTTMNEMMFHSLAYDKRLDLVVVFRILRRDEYGGLTVLWKELDRKDAAKIKFGKTQSLRDFRSEGEQ